MQRHACREVRPRRRRRVVGGQLDERGAAPLRDLPVWGLEVRRAGDGAQGGEVVEGEGEGVGEGVAVDEEGGGEG